MISPLLFLISGQSVSVPLFFTTLGLNYNSDSKIFLILVLSPQECLRPVDTLLRFRPKRVLVFLILLIKMFFPSNDTLHNELLHFMLLFLTGLNSYSGTL